MAKRIRYNKKTQPFLSYQNPEQYLEESARFTLPTDPLILVKHLNQFSRFAEVLVRDVFSCTDPEQDNALASAMMRLDRLSVNLSLVFELAWNWFLEIESMRGEFTARLANARLLSWSQCCTLFYLVIYSGDRESDRILYKRLRGPASDFCYCAMLLSKGSNVVITDTPIDSYSLDELWLSMRLIIPTLYQNPYDRDMKEYFYALLFRYAAFFTASQKNLTKLMDNPKFYRKITYGKEDDKEKGKEEEETFDEYKEQKVEIGEGYCLTSDYFYEGEILFKSQLRRFFLSIELEKANEEYRLILKEETSPSRLILVRESCLKMLGEVSTHGELRQSINEEFKRACLSLYLYHGEAERWKRLYPNMNTRASEILAQARPADLKHATKVITSTIAETLKDPSLEKEMVLVTKIVTHQLFLYDGVKKADAIDKCFLLEELVTLDELETQIDAALSRERRLGARRLPLLVKLMSIYYVIHEGFLFKSLDFTQVYMIWLTILVVRLEVIHSEKIYPTIKEFIKNFVILD